MADIAGIVERAVLARLADQTIGFNARHAAVVQQNTYKSVDAAAINFTQGSLNFQTTRVPMGLILNSSDWQFPYLMLDVQVGQNAQGPQQLKSTQFSGNVSVSIEIAHSWEQEDVGDFSTEPNAAISAMYGVFNSLPALNWAPEVIYNGGLSFIKNPPQQAGENWTRSTVFTAQFYVVVV